jgi:hypothetical protein
MPSSAEILREALAAVAAEGGDPHDALAAALEEVGGTSRFRCAARVLRHGAGGRVPVDDTLALDEVRQLVSRGIAQDIAIATVARRLSGDQKRVRRRLRDKLKKGGGNGFRTPQTPDMQSP